MSSHLLSSLVFAPDQTVGQEDTIILPLLKNQGILHAISIGPAAENMSDFHHNGSPQEIMNRQEKFLAKNNLASLSQACISIKPASNQPSIVDITSDYLAGENGPLIIKAESLFTTLPGVPLIHRPADCPTAIITAKNKNGEQILGITHLGRPQVNDRVTEATLDHLFNHYQIAPTDIYIGIAPGIGPDHYFIKANDQTAKHFLDLPYWGNFAYEDTFEGEKIIRVDVLGKILSILKNADIPGENIEAYGHDDAVDTYTLAAKNPPEAFSYRYSMATNRPDRNGRILVAAQIPQG